MCNDFARVERWKGEECEGERRFVLSHIIGLVYGHVGNVLARSLWSEVDVVDEFLGAMCADLCISSDCVRRCGLKDFGRILKQNQRVKSGNGSSHRVSCHGNILNLCIYVVCC